MVSNFIEQVQGLISQCRDFENQHNEKMLEIAIITLEKVVKNELDEEIPDDLREVNKINTLSYNCISIINIQTKNFPIFPVLFWQGCHKIFAIKFHDHIT